MKLVFERVKETKNTVVFSEKPEPGKPPVIGTVYVQKWFVGEAAEITIDIEKGGDK